MKKVLTIALCLLAVIILSACAKETAYDREIIGGADENTAIIVSDDNADKDNEVVVSDDNADKKALILQQQAIDIAHDKLCELDFDEFGMASAKPEDFALRDCLLDDDYFSKLGRKDNPVLTVRYDYTPSVCDFIYFNIDAVTGEILHYGWMGD